MILKLLRSNLELTRAFSQTSSLWQDGKQSALSVLRKNTGYGLAKCREALAKHNGDIELATKWLNEQAQKEGWTKAEKLKNRQTSQGTLVLALDKLNNKATLVEINCETDFVARNEKFLDMSSNIANSVITNVKTAQTKTIISKEDLIKLNYLNESKTIGDYLALSIGSLGENMSIRRAAVFNLPKDQYLSWYMHGGVSSALNSCHFGKFGALVSTSQTGQNDNYKPYEIGRQIAQQIVGLKPASIGEMPPPLKKLEDGTFEVPKIDESETRLLHQEFLMKPSLRVGDFLNQNSTAINEYVRFECGEVLDTESK